MLLFVARRPPFPLVNGARIRTHRLLSGLAREFETTFVTFEHHPASPDGHMSRDELARELPDIHQIVTVRGCGRGKRLRQTGTLLSGRSWEYGRYERPELRTKLEEVVALARPGIIHFDDLGVAQHGPFAGALNVYSAHNVEYRILEGTARTSYGARRLFARLERRKVEPIERRAWTSMDLTLACSALDRDEMQKGGANAVVCPNGSDPVGPLPLPRRKPEEVLRLLFVGSCSYRPNQLGLEWFINDVLPLLRGTFPIVVDIVGTPPKRLPAVPEILIHGRVASVERYYKIAHAAIVPVLYGSGTRLKAIEAMAYGRPLISTGAGTEGLPVAAGDHFFQADDAPRFAAAISEVAERCSRRTIDLELVAMLERARAAVAPLFWPRIVSELVRAYRDHGTAVAAT